MATGKRVALQPRRAGALPSRSAARLGKLRQSTNEDDAMNSADFDLEAEPVQVKRPSRAGAVVSVRLSPDEADRLQDTADAEGVTLSKLVREAVSIFLTGVGMSQFVFSPPTGTTTGSSGVELTFPAQPVVRTRAADSISVAAPSGA